MLSFHKERLCSYNEGQKLKDFLNMLKEVSPDAQGRSQYI
jgi:hypothetical protein